MTAVASAVTKHSGMTKLHSTVLDTDRRGPWLPGHCVLLAVFSKSPLLAFFSPWHLNVGRLFLWPILLFLFTLCGHLNQSHDFKYLLHVGNSNCILRAKSFPSETSPHREIPLWYLENISSHPKPVQFIPLLQAGIDPSGKPMPWTWTMGWAGGALKLWMYPTCPRCLWRMESRKTQALHTGDCPVVCVPGIYLSEPSWNTFPWFMRKVQEETT